MKNRTRNWRQHEFMWVIGCITFQGAIFANPSKEGRTHRLEESCGRRWRWCIWSQEFCEVFMGEGITAEEFHIVKEWLIKNGYAEDASF